jgi:hypothetical protein
VTVIFRFSEPAADRLLASEEIIGRIGLTLDDTVSAALASLMPRVAERVAQVSRAKSEEAARIAAAEAARREEEAAQRAAEEAARIAAEEQRPAAGEETEEGAETATAGQRPEEPAEAEEGAEAGTAGEGAAEAAAVVEGEERFRRLELALGFAPFVPVGTPNDYLMLGYAPSLSLAYRFPRARGALAAGLHGGLMYLAPETPDEVAYLRWLIDLGLDFRYVVPRSTRVRMYLQLSAGAAYRLPDDPNAESLVSQELTRVLPYGRAGVGMFISVSQRFGVAIDALYHGYFYLYQDPTAAGGALRVEVVSGLLPSLNVYFRL